MPNPDNEPQLPKNQSPIIDDRTGLVARDWYRFFLNLLNKANSGGGGGSGTVTSVNVSGGTTGLTTSGGPVTTSGTITLDGTLDVDNGGTGATTASGARANLSAAVLGTNDDITSMTGVTGGISSPDFIQFDTTATVTDAPGRLYYDDEDQFQTLTFQMNGATIQRVGEELYYRVKLSSAANKGDVLMFTGTLGSSGGLTAAPATGLLPEQANYILGLAHESGITNDWVFVTTFGEIRQIDTTGGAETWAQGDVLYYNPLVTGGLTKTKPTAPAAICSVAAVVHVGSSNGILFVRPTYGSVLGGTDGNVNFTSLASGNTLIYDAVAGVWENADLTAGTAISVTNGAGSITIANTGVTSAIASTGISVSSATGDVTFTNTAPDQTVVLTAGTGISTSGTYPNFTITNTLPMTYPGAGIPNSTGTAWSTSYSTTGSGTVVALATSPSFTTPILGTPQSGDFSTGTFTWPTFNQNTTGTASNVTGTVAIANGGTGATTANAAMTNLMGFTSTVTAAGTTTLTNTSSYYQLFTGSTTQTVVLPVTSTLQTGWTFHICNNSIGTVTVRSSGGNLVISIPAGITVMCTCVGTTLTTAADWEAGYTDFSTRTGTNAVVLQTQPAITSPTINGQLDFVGTTSNSSNFHTTQTSGVMTIGGTSGTGSITLGRSTVSQQTNIQAGATASGSTKTINFGTAGLSGSTTTITIGSAVAGATSTTTLNGVVTLANALAVSSGGTGATTAAAARTNLGATTVGGNFFTLTNPSAITFPQINADNTVSALDAATFRTAIGAGTGSGTVTSVTGTSPVASSGGTTPVISLSSSYGDTQNPYASKTANFVLAAPDGIAGVPTFRAIVAADIPTLNQNTTGSAATLTTGRTISITGDLAYTSPSFNGSANVTAAGTLATVNANVGSFTNASITVNGKGLITAASSGTAPVTSVTGTSPVVSSGGATPAISLASGYGDTQNPYASKTANFFLAAPNGSAGVPTFRAIVAADIPTLNQNTTGSAATLTTARTIQTNLASTSAASFNGSANITPGVTGTLPIANGGTGETTRQAAIDALAGAVTSGQYLRGNGTDVVMSAIQAADVPTLNQNTTGTAANVTGVVAIANGGTGQTTASAAFNALSPVTSTGDLIIGNGANSSTRLPIGSNNFVLTSNGTTATWAAPTGGSGATITNDTTTSTNLYPTFAAATSGALANIYTGDAKYLYKPSTGELTSEHFVAGNGIFVNSLTIDTSYTIAAGTSGMSAGPVTVSSGTTVTVSSGSRWVVV